MARGGTGFQLPFPKQAPGNHASRKQPEQHGGSVRASRFLARGLPRALATIISSTKLVAVGNPTHSRDVEQCRGGRVPRWRCSCLTATKLYPLDRRAWLLAIGRRLRVEYDAIAKPVPPRLAALVNQLETPAQGRGEEISKPAIAADHPVQPRSDWDEDPGYPLLSSVAMRA